MSSDKKDFVEVIPNSSNNHSLRNEGRHMLSRQNEKSISITTILNPGKHMSGSLVCCSSPACCPICSIFPCCDEAEYIKLKRESSKYVFIRENSLEWNEPKVILKKGSFLGLDPCNYDIQDNVTVLYFDDPMFDRLTDQTRFLNEFRTCLCGGKGERVRIDAPFCFSCCLRSHCIPFVPSCCPTSLCPCVLRYEIYLEDAQKGLYEIRKSRKKALRDFNLDETLSRSVSSSYSSKL